MTHRRGTCWSRSRRQNVVELEVALTIPKTFLLEKVSVLVFTGRGTWRKGSSKAALPSLDSVTLATTKKKAAGQRTEGEARAGGDAVRPPRPRHVEAGEVLALGAGTHTSSGACWRQEARQGVGAREAAAGVEAEASSPATEQQRPEVNRRRWGDELAPAMAGHKAWAWPDAGERRRRRRCELQRRARRQGGLAGRRGAMARRRSRGTDESRGTKEREVARALLSFPDGASKEEGIERGTIDGEGENWIGQRVRSASH